MQFLLLIHESENQTRTPADREAMQADYVVYTKELMAAGVMRGGDPLQPSATGAKVSVREGKRRVVDGPFTEAKEVLGGYYMIDVPDLAAAVGWAEKCPGAKVGTMEVREVRPYPKP